MAILLTLKLPNDYSKTKHNKYTRSTQKKKKTFKKQLSTSTFQALKQQAIAVATNNNNKNFI
jgi:hypothetical protein